MDFGGGRLMKVERKKVYSFKGWIFGILTILFLMNLCLDFYHYNNYQGKIDLLAEMLQMEDSSGAAEKNMDTVISLLNGNHAMTGEGKDIIKEYGYLQMGRNCFQIEFYRQCAMTAVFSAALFCLFLVVVWWQKRRGQEEREQLLTGLEQCLVRLRQDNQEPVLFQEEWSEGDREEADRGAVSRLNHQMEALQEQLVMVQERAVREKEGVKELVTDISHQLKTPVAALDTCLEILTDSSLSERERMEFVGRCRNELDGLELFLKSLLQISRMEAGLIQIQLREVSVLTVLTAAVNRIYPKALEKDIEITVDYPRELEGFCVMLDEKWFCEAVINLLDNGVKYSPAGKEIKISLQRRSSLLRIEIQDEGIGIPKSEHHKIFQRFYRGTDSRVKKETGSGVGLYLVREIVRKHYGTVSVTSFRDRSKWDGRMGSVFVVQIPIQVSK